MARRRTRRRVARSLGRSVEPVVISLALAPEPCGTCGTRPTRIFDRVGRPLLCPTQKFWWFPQQNPLQETYTVFGVHESAHCTLPGINVTLRFPPRIEDMQNFFTYLLFNYGHCSDSFLIHEVNVLRLIITWTICIFSIKLWINLSQRSQGW